MLLGKNQSDENYICDQLDQKKYNGSEKRQKSAILDERNNNQQFRNYHEIHQQRSPQVRQKSRSTSLINNPSAFNDPRDIMNKKLLVIFTFYASFGDRINVNHLRSNKLHKLLQDARLKNRYNNWFRIVVLVQILSILIFYLLNSTDKTLIWILKYSFCYYNTSV